MGAGSCVRSTAAAAKQVGADVVGFSGCVVAVHRLKSFGSVAIPSSRQDKRTVPGYYDAVSRRGAGQRIRHCLEC
jgi:hypothetical protein